MIGLLIQIFAAPSWKPFWVSVAIGFAVLVLAMLDLLAITIGFALLGLIWAGLSNGRRRR